MEILLFVSGIQMQTDTYDGNEKGVSFCRMDDHGMKAIVVEDTVIDPLCAGAVPVDLFKSFCTAWNRRIEAYIPFRLGIDDPSVGGSGAAVFTGIASSCSDRASPLHPAPGTAVPPENHASACLADRSAVRIDAE